MHLVQILLPRADNTGHPEVMVDNIDLPDWRKRRAELERRFRQDTVITRYMPMPFV
jgi:hypothetical protein